MVDPVDLILAEHGTDLLVQGLGRGQVVAERLLDHDPRPAAGAGTVPVALHQPGGAEAIDDGRVGGRRGGQIVEAVAAAAALAVQRGADTAQLLIAGRVIEAGLDVADAPHKAVSA